eukprot:6573283-Pyramimonas_sp.AAC.1
MADQADARRAGIFSRRTNQTQDARVYSHGGPITQVQAQRPQLLSAVLEPCVAGLLSDILQQTAEALRPSGGAPLHPTVQHAHLQLELPYLHAALAAHLTPAARDTLQVRDNNMCDGDYYCSGEA